jgi:hypothetical protein
VVEPDRRLKVIREFLEEKCLPVLDVKGHDYTHGIKKSGGLDANANFKEVARLLKGRGVDRFDVWAVYFLKHFLSLMTWLNDRQVKSESLESRIVDLVNYLLILKTMLVEDDDEKE